MERSKARRIAMTTGILFLLNSGLGFSEGRAQEAGGADRDEGVRAVSIVLDALHRNASIANEESYFSLFAPEGVFHGTDGSERWTVDEFRGYAHPVFERGQGWTYTVREGRRFIEIDPSGSVAWFDEVLDNVSYGECRGTGVLRLIAGEWKIAQYNLTIPIPNELATGVVAMIRGVDGN